MKQLSTLFLGVALLAGTASAQQYLYENHNTSVPGPGWTQVKVYPAAAGWIMSGDQRAWHEDEIASGLNDDMLVSPSMDLSAAGSVYVHFYSQLNWANYLANHPSSLGNGENDLWVSTDGGVTWTEVWTDTRQANGTEWTHVDISSYAGNSNVQIGLRFYGDYAQEWWIDEVVVDANPIFPPPPFNLTKTGTCPGSVTLATAGGTANSQVAILYGNAGSFTKPSGVCAGLTLGISSPNLGVMLNANGAGAASVTFNTSPAYCGRTVQGVDVASCTATNTIVL